MTPAEEAADALLSFAILLVFVAALAAWWTGCFDGIAQAP